MTFTGRTRELGILRGMLDGREASVVTVTGLRGVGKSAFVRRAVESFESLTFRAPPLPEPEQRRRLQEVIAAAAAAEEGRGGAQHGHGGAGDRRGNAGGGRGSSWHELFRRALDQAEPAGPPLVLVVDDVERLAQSRARYLDPLLDTLRAARERARPLHAVLVGAAAHLPDESALEGRSGGSIRLAPLPFRAARPFLPGAGPTDLLRAYGLLGGIPAVLRAVDRSVTAETNLRRLVLEPGAPFVNAGAVWLERDLQAPVRYYAILRALSGGEAAWGPVHAGVPDLTASGQVAPYLRKLAELGLIEARASLDAGRTSRARRYRIVDPFLASWFRFGLPRLSGEGPGDALAYQADVVRPQVEPHLERVFPEICRQYMAYDAAELLGAHARDCGSLWGSGYDVPVAGVLSSGAAFYGECSWTGFTRSEEPLGRLDGMVSETRYGFGRERRLRLVFTGRAAPQWLRREVARREDAAVVDAAALVEGA